MKRFFLLLLVLACCACSEEYQESFDLDERYQWEVQEIDSRLKVSESEVVNDPSGIRMIVNKLGSGWIPRAGQTVTVNYSGWLFDTGVVFEEGTITQPISNFIPGWIHALEILPEGSEATVYIPSLLAYKNEDLRNIPPNSILVFSMHLESIDLPATELDQFNNDLAVMDAFFKDNNEETLLYDEGIYYAITEWGDGKIPGPYEKLQVTYQGKVFSNDSIFYSGTIGPEEGFDSRPVDFLPGLYLLFRNLPTGSQAKAYIPSTLGFGDQAVPGVNVMIPENSILVYEITAFDLAN